MNDANVDCHTAVSEKLLRVYEKLVNSVKIINVKLGRHWEETSKLTEFI